MESHYRNGRILGLGPQPLLRFYPCFHHRCRCRGVSVLDPRRRQVRRGHPGNRLDGEAALGMSEHQGDFHTSSSGMIGLFILASSGFTL